ncbi:MAG: SDR family oxidoreductase [bacterium]|nr:MAG: SDR family oxidoreductase [bacterium]
MGNNIVITGASSEIGLAIYKKIVKPGDTAILQCNKNSNKLKDNVSINCEVITADFTDHKSLDHFLEKIKKTDILINVAAVTKTNLLPYYQDEDIKMMIDVNIVSLVKICRSVIPAMIIKKKGCIVNISSVAASRGNRGQSVYAGTKGFVESFSRSLAAEYGSKNIRVNCVAPGPIDAGALKKLLIYADDEVKKSIVSPRLGTPDDVAAVVAFLCSEGATFINGKIIPVDGGTMMGL